MTVRRILFLTVFLVQRPAASPAPVLDYAFFCDLVRPIFLKKWPDHGRCIACHQHRSPLLQPLSPGASTWDEAQSRRNFEVWKLFVTSGQPMKSPLLLYPLARGAGGDRFHAGSKHFLSQNGPGWQILAAVPEPVALEQRRGAAGFYEVGNISNVAGAGQLASLQYIHRLGLENIRAHARPLTDRLRKEIPRLSLPCITLEHNESTTIAFAVKDPAATRAKLKRANVIARVGKGELRPWHKLRVSPSVYNNQDDIDRLLNALG